MSPSVRITSWCFVLVTLRVLPSTRAWNSISISSRDAAEAAALRRPTGVLSRRAAAADSDVENSSIPPTFPLARRMLIEKAKEIDPALAGGSTKGSYSTVGWSNRLGTALTPAAVPGVYEAGRPFIWNSIDVGCRMTVIELQQTSTTGPGGTKPDLFVHSPVAIDDRLADAIDKLGNVRHVVSPNYEHVKFAYQWAERYPDARIWGCPGLMEREPNVRWTGELPEGCRPPGYGESEEGPPPAKPIGGNGEEMWDWDEVQPLHVDCEVNPFTGRPFFNECVFYHAPSKTLLTTDTYWNYPRLDGVTNANYAGLPGGSGSPAQGEEEEQDFGAWELAPEVGQIPLGSRLWKFGMDEVFRPFYLNLMVKSDSRDKFRKIASYMCGLEGGWDVRQVIPAHGDIIRGKVLCQNLLKEHFNLGS